MPEDTEVGKWVTPDGVELEVPAEHVKSLEGLNERFNKLTTREQELAAKEKGLEAGYAKRLENDREEWLQGMTREEWAEYQKLMFPEDETKPPDKKPDATVGADNEVLKKLQELEGWKNQREQQEAEQRRQAEIKEAEQALDKTFRELAGGSDAFKSLSCDKSREMAIGRAWDAMNESNYEMSEQEAIERAVKEQMEYEKDIIDAYGNSKRAGPGAPGKPAGTAQEIADLTKDPQKRHQHLVDILKRGVGEEE